MLEKLEPTLNELLAEPIIRQIMASDGVNSDDIRRLMTQARLPVEGGQREPHRRVFHVLKIPPNWLCKSGATNDAASIRK
jgi:hypothetical protein